MRNPFRFFVELMQQPVWIPIWVFYLMVINMASQKEVERQILVQVQRHKRRHTGTSMAKTNRRILTVLCNG